MKIISIILIIFSYSVVIGQNNKKLPERWKKYQYDYKVTLTKVDFYVNDTIMLYTLIQEPDGAFTFKEGHLFTKDSVPYDYHMVYHHSLKKHKDTLIPNVIFMKNKEVLKLNDFTSHYSLKNHGILNTYDFDFHFKPLIHELTYSYIFQKLGLPKIAEMSNDSIIRLTSYKTSPISPEAPQVTIYELTPAFKQIKKLNYSIDSNHNFVMDKQEIIPLKKNETNNLNNSFQSSIKEDIKFSTKTKQYNPFLIEVKLEDYIEIIERSDGLDSDELNGNVHKYHSEYQSFVSLVNKYGNLSPSKIEKRKQKLNK